MTITKKHCSDPWLKYIQDGVKTYEGRLNVDPWTKVKIGDKIKFHNESREVIVQIIGKDEYIDFGDAYNVYKDKLLPEITSTDNAKTIYRQFFDDISVEKYGVIIFHLQIINT
jgi:ASC-1-like (ASCH) protein